MRTHSSCQHVTTSRYGLLITVGGVDGDFSQTVFLQLRRGSAKQYVYMPGHIYGKKNYVHRWGSWREKYVRLFLWRDNCTGYGVGSGIYNRLKNSINGVKVASANSAHLSWKSQWMWCHSPWSVSSVMLAVHRYSLWRLSVMVIYDYLRWLFT